MVAATLCQPEWLRSLSATCRAFAVHPDHHYIAVVGDRSGACEDVLRSWLSRQGEGAHICRLGATASQTALAIDLGRTSGDAETRLWGDVARSVSAGGAALGAGPALPGHQGLWISVLVAGWLAGQAATRADSWRIAALVSLLAQDPTRARSFVHAVLGPLAEDSVAAAQDRQTLAAYLTAGRSLRHVAEQQHVHRNTVVYRLHRLTERLPVPLDGAEVDLVCALRVMEVLGVGALDELASHPPC